MHKSHEGQRDHEGIGRRRLLPGFVTVLFAAVLLSLQFSGGFLSANTGDTGNSAESESAGGEECVVSAQKLDQAKADFANACTEPRVDCDKLDNVWYCSSRIIGTSAPGGVGGPPSTIGSVATTTPPTTAAPTTPGSACTASADKLSDAKARFADSCTTARVDCDRLDGVWVCSDEVIGANAPGTSQPAPATSTTEPRVTTTTEPPATTTTTTEPPVTTTTEAPQNCVANTSGHADLSADLISLQYDHAPDKDDGHATAAGKTISLDIGFTPWVVGGAYGADNAHRYRETSEPVMDAVWGSDNWVNAHDDWPLAVRLTADAWQDTLVSCGDIWIAEGGQSDLSADVVRELQKRMPNLDTTERIHLIQHSGWNETMTLDADLRFVEDNTDYLKINDGNSNGNGTADFNEANYSGPFEAAALDSSVGNGWSAAFDYLPTSDKLDFSDTVELMHILDIGVNEVADVEDFSDRFFDTATPVQPTPISPTSGAFIESGGVVTIETTSLDVPNDWRQFPSEAGNDPIRPGATNGQYIQWGGGNDFANPGRGAFTIPVEITNPGRYRFIWHSATGLGTQSSEHNDSWLRINADSFYGEKPGSIVCPTGTPSSNRCDGDDPNGRSADGWFKIYRSGTPSDGFTWQSATSDSDAHTVYVEFDTAGTYEIEISGRSDGHAIDRIVLFRNGNDSHNVNINDATSLSNPESVRR